MDGCGITYQFFFFLREGNDPGDHGQITFRELLEQVCKFSNVLKSLGNYPQGASFCMLADSRVRNIYRNTYRQIAVQTDEIKTLTDRWQHRQVK